MKSIAGWKVAAVLVAGWLGLGIAFADDPPKGPEPPKGDGKKEANPPENVNENAGMDAWMKHGKLTDEHTKVLARFVGSWDSTSRMSMMPGQPEREMKGTLESKLILGGRFVETSAKGEFGGKPLESFGLMGYDTIQKKFTSESADSMGTWVVHALGDYDGATQTITLHGEYADPMSDGKVKMKFRWTFRFVNDDEFVFEMYEVPPPELGAEYKSITITYQRQKANRTVGDAPMRLGNFSVSLAVKDLRASLAFYEKLGFRKITGDPARNWVILQNETSTIGLFQGMFDKNGLTFNPGWDKTCSTLPDYEDVREIQRTLKSRGLVMASAADESTSGPASLMLLDPDGNPILIDQHAPSPRK